MVCERQSHTTVGLFHQKGLLQLQLTRIITLFCQMPHFVLFFSKWTSISGAITFKNVLHGYCSGRWRGVQIALCVGHFLLSLIDCTEEWLRVLQITMQSWQCQFICLSKAIQNTCNTFLQLVSFPVIEHLSVIAFIKEDDIIHFCGHWVICLKSFML